MVFKIPLMRLTRFTDLALRALMYLGAHPGRTVPSRELADVLNVSRDHLLKALQALDDRGLVTARRGRGGGYALAPGVAGPSAGSGSRATSSGEVRLGQLVRSLEPTLALAECFEAGSTCPLTGDCRLAAALSQARAAFFDTLDRHSLADLVASEGPRLVQLGRAS
jgi:Rrf2 family nitric oxide-sensitive transcriptional repressor